MLITEFKACLGFEGIKPESERGDNYCGYPFGGCLRTVRGFDLMRVTATSTSLALPLLSAGFRAQLLRP